MTVAARRIPTTIVAGALGVGKTSAIVGLAAHQPADERWVVLVNELGEVGIDGAMLEGIAGEGSAADGGTALAVHELAGGCLCCTGRGPMRASLRQVLATTRPDRLIIEPSGVADLGRVVELVRQDFAEQLELRATITLVDPRALDDGARRRPASWQQQVDGAVVLVGNKIDRCDGPTVQGFMAWAAALFPPKQLVVTTVGGELDPAWLDLMPAAAAAPEHALEAAMQPQSAPRWIDQTGLLPEAIGRAIRVIVPGHGYAHRGWQFPPDLRFRASGLESLATALVTPGGLLPTGAVRLKAVFHTDRGWQLLQADVDGVRWSPTGWRQDSRLEVIADARPAPDWPAIAAAVKACQLP